MLRDLLRQTPRTRRVEDVVANHGKVAVGVDRPTHLHADDGGIRRNQPLHPRHVARVLDVAALEMDHVERAQPVERGHASPYERTEQRAGQQRTNRTPGAPAPDDRLLHVKGGHERTQEQAGDPREDEPQVPPGVVGMKIERVERDEREKPRGNEQISAFSPDREVKDSKPEQEGERRPEAREPECEVLESWPEVRESELRRQVPVSGGDQMPVGRRL